MRDRLIELLCNVKCEGEECFGNCPHRIGQKCNKVQRLEMCSVFAIADHLLAAGVIVPPCKVGDTVYVPWAWGDREGIASPIVECIQIVRATELCGFFIDMKSDDTAFNDVYGFWRTFADIGKKIFLTKEEAERALAERREG